MVELFPSAPHGQRETEVESAKECQELEGETVALDPGLSLNT